MKKLVLILLSTLAISSNAISADIEAGKSKAASCISCHGADGNGGADKLWPKLAGQGEAYLVKQMKDFAQSKRKDALMNGMIMTITEADYANVAAYYASLPVTHSSVDDKFFEAGQKLYRAGDSERKVTACGACHGAAGEGIAAAGFPSLSGQTAEYIAKQLKMFRDGSRANDANSVMQDVTKLMSDEQIAAISHYVAALH